MPAQSVGFLNALTCRPNRLRYNKKVTANYMGLKLNCILLIDDDEVNNYHNMGVIKSVHKVVNIQTQKTVLSALNYLAASGGNAKRDTALHFPDLILLDISMPGLDGWDFLHFYKNAKYTYIRMPIIIVLSSSFNTSDKEKAMAMQEVSGVYSKPLTREIIKSIFATYFA